MQPGPGQPISGGHPRGHTVCVPVHRAGLQLPLRLLCLMIHCVMFHTTDDQTRPPRPLRRWTLLRNKQRTVQPDKMSMAVSQQRLWPRDTLLGDPRSLRLMRLCLAVGAPLSVSTAAAAVQAAQHAGGALMGRGGLPAPVDRDRHAWRSIEGKSTGGAAVRTFMARPVLDRVKSSRRT